MALAEDVARLADEVRKGSGEIKTEITTFPSGAVSLRIQVGTRVFDLDYLPSSGMFGVDELEADTGFNTGYRFGFQDFESAREKLLNLLNSGDRKNGPPGEATIAGSRSATPD